MKKKMSQSQRTQKKKKKRTKELYLRNKIQTFSEIMRDNLYLDNMFAIMVIDKLKEEYADFSALCAMFFEIANEIECATLEERNEKVSKLFFAAQSISDFAFNCESVDDSEIAAVDRFLDLFIEFINLTEERELYTSRTLDIVQNTPLELTDRAVKPVENSNSISLA